MKKRALILAMITFIAAATSEPSINMVRAEETQTEENTAQTSELPIKTLTQKVIDENPYMAASDSNIHHDCYNTDSTDEVLPVGIYSEINVSYEKTNANASPAIFFDSYGHAVVPLLGGLAIRDINAEETQTLGYFSPKQHDNGEYLIQSSYSFVDESNRLVCPTNNNHVLMLKATDEDGNVLPEFEKVLDIDIKAAAEAALGKTLDQNLLAVVFDYEGNLWFATGGFRIYPDRKQQGAMGYISRTAIDAILNGEETDLSDAVFVYELAPGEGAENGIAASKDGAVILTNQNCYLLQADNGVKKIWETPYESAGAKESKEGDETTGGGLAWGSGCSPSLTKDLVMFTDNQETVNLLALDMKTGEVVASLPVIDELPEGSQVSVENSAIVYDNGAGTVSTIVCNWFGAGSANLGKEDSDSSIQSYTNIYDENWLKQGNKMITPGVERVDTIKTEDGYEMKSIWCRSDLSDTSMMKLSTATGYIYGYVQNLETGMWQYIILDFETGETVFSMDVASKPMYNNMAIGMYAGNSGNSLYCPTGYLELLRLQDRFVYLPEMPYRKVDLDQAMRNVLSQEKFAADGGLGDVEGWLNTITIENVHPNTTVAIRMKGISGETGSLKLYAYGTDGTLKEVPAEKWHIQTEDGETPDTLSEDVLYEVHMTVEDGGDFDLSETEKEIKISAVLGI
ncbi:hypothetical protein RO865_07460 [Blautia faecis]|jgi:hypothetical protein|uniref:hypothetical protein n=2 Tax=Bacillota TaxID=1239 RepID=UPI0006C219C2|nr:MULTISPECIES: hypothetical protein [Clostridia]CUQ21540.1 Uncharacterised protein [[Ruminococcus] torques]SCI98455.1 Uncharacterised protein [uncultured Ruminococcus sp.]MBT9857636.1 hypothetical protein [Blautia faecis]MCB5383549.1 hypothetical protein [Blautia glucerasea]MCB6329571.1 hypothetical protein [Blautia faecis]